MTVILVATKKILTNLLYLKGEGNQSSHWILDLVCLLNPSNVQCTPLNFQFQLHAIRVFNKIYCSILANKNIKTLMNLLYLNREGSQIDAGYKTSFLNFFSSIQSVPLILILTLCKISFLCDIIRYVLCFLTKCKGT